MCHCFIPELVWVTISTSRIALLQSRFTVLLYSRAGLSNYLYLCTLPSKQKPFSKEPKEVLLRVYGEIFYEGDAPLLDTVVFSLLSERRHAPKLYGVFREGRLEQYIPVSCFVICDPAPLNEALWGDCHNPRRIIHCNKHKNDYSTTFLSKITVCWTSSCMISLKTTL